MRLAIKIGVLVAASVIAVVTLNKRKTVKTTEPITPAEDICSTKKTWIDFWIEVMQIPNVPELKHLSTELTFVDIAFNPEWNNTTDYFDALVRTEQFELVPGKVLIAHTGKINNRWILIIPGATPAENKVWFQRYTGDYKWWVKQHKVGEPLSLLDMLNDVKANLV